MEIIISIDRSSKKQPFSVNLLEIMGSYRHVSGLKHFQSPVLALGYIKSLKKQGHGIATQANYDELTRLAKMY